MSLSTDELMLLNNLIYLQEKSIYNPWGRELQVIDDCFEGKTVGEFLNSIVVDTARSNDNRAFISGQEWSETVRAIQSNPELMNMVIKEGQKDTASGGGEGESVLLVNPSSNEAVMVFRGTADREWYDDFYGGGPTTTWDGVSTPQQINARDWFNDMYNKYDLEQYDVIVTGHSKGGNKAKYITLLEGNAKVDKCVSFDGQGFSEEFWQVYSSKINDNIVPIENHNVDYDFVNLLLHDVGDRYFYKSQNITGFAEYHSPNSFYQVQPNGELYYRCIGSNPPQVMTAVHNFTNNLLDCLPDGMKVGGLAFIGKVFEAGWNLKWNGLDLSPLFEVFSDISNRNILNEILKHVEMKDIISLLDSFLSEFGIELPDNIMDSLYGVCDIIDRSIPVAGEYDINEKNVVGLERDSIKNLAGALAAGAAAGVAAVATINAKNSEEEHLVHDNMYFGPRPEEEGAEQLISGAEQLAEIGVLDEEYEHKNDYGGLSHGGGMYEHIGSAMEEAEEEYSGGYNSHGGAFYHDLEQEESGVGGTGSHGLSNGFQMGALAGLEVESNQNSAASFAGQLADNSHGFDEFVVGNGFSAAVLGGANMGANAFSKNSKSFVAVLNGMANGREKLINASGHMSVAAVKVNAISNITIGTTNTEKILSSIKAEINQENNECKELHVSFSKITDIYRKNEESLTTKKYKNQKRLDSSEKPPLHPGMLHSPDFSHMIPHSPNHPAFIKPEMPSPEEWHDNHTAFIKPEMPSPEEWHDNHPEFIKPEMPSPEEGHDNHTEFIKPEMPPLEPHSMNERSMMGAEPPLDPQPKSERSMAGAEPPLDPQPKSERSMVGAEPPLDPQPKSERSMMGVEPPLNPTYGREPGPGSHVAPQDSSDFAVEPSQTIRPESSHALTYGREPGPGSHVAPQDENVFTNPRSGMHAAPHRSGDIEKMQQMGQVEQGSAIGPHPNTETATGVMGVAEPSLDDARTVTQRGASKQVEKRFDMSYMGER